MGHGEGSLQVLETEAAKEPSRVGRGLSPRLDGPMGPTKQQMHHSGLQGWRPGCFMEVDLLVWPLQSGPLALGLGHPPAYLGLSPTS